MDDRSGSPGDDDFAGSIEAEPTQGAPNPELGVLHDQVDQARRILDDAVARLSRSFATVAEETRLQKRLLASLLGTLSGEDAGAPTPIPMSATASAPVDASASRRGDLREFIGEMGTVLGQFTHMLASSSRQSRATVRSMDGMVAQLDGVFALVKDINGIADETYILAVNAQLEAVRASQTGGAGNSFSVIAAHVRELSRKTRAFNAQIAEQVGEARNTVAGVRHCVSEMASLQDGNARTGEERAQAMLGQLKELQGIMAAGMDGADRSANRIVEATSQAITGMQFEDILSQLLVSIRHHADRLATPVSDAASASALAELCPPRVESVQQHDMVPGAIELF